LVREEFEPGLVAAAPPIRGAGRVVAALNISAPRFRFDDRPDRAASRVAAAGILSAAIGGRAMAA
jgi:DNA-binding IclR family transcriptional regulator